MVYSPFGLSSAIAMAMEGVDSKMAADIATTLRLERPTVAKQILRLGFKALLEEFEVSDLNGLIVFVVFFHLINEFIFDSFFEIHVNFFCWRRPSKTKRIQLDRTIELTYTALCHCCQSTKQFWRTSIRRICHIMSPRILQVDIL